MKLKRKIILILFSCSIILIVFVISVIYYFTRTNLTNEMRMHLETIAKDKAKLVNNYFEKKKEDIAVVATSLSARQILDNNLNENSEVAKSEIKNKTEKIANEINDFLIKNPNMTLEDLQNSKDFQNIAVQTIGKTGYTAIIDYDNLIIRFHEKESMNNYDLHLLASELPRFWEIMLKMKGGIDSEGAYDWKEPDGKITKKYLYASTIKTKTADKVGLSVVGTAYLDDFSNNLGILESAQERLKNLMSLYGYKNSFYVDTNGNVKWATSDDPSVGTNLIDGPFKDTNLSKVFHEALDNKKISFTDYEIAGNQEEPILYISDPIYISDNTNTDDVKNMDGVVIFELSSQQINQVMTDRSGLGNTGEVYLVAKDLLMRSDSIFYPNSTILKLKVNTDNVNNCFGDLGTSKLDTDNDMSHHSDHGELMTFTGYRGNQVLGTHFPIKDLQWCVLSEVSESEAMTPVSNLVRIFFLIATLYIILIYFVINWLSKMITSPIKALQGNVESVEKGNLDQKINIDTKDEIGQLSRSFEKMTLAIKKSREEIDKKVIEQTGQINQQKTNLENQQRAILNILEDVEEEKDLASREREKSEAILYSIGDAVFVIDDERKIVMFNEAAAEISGFTVNESVGKHYKEVLRFINEKDNQVVDDFIEDAIKTGKVKEMSSSTVILRKDGQKTPVADSAAPLKDTNGRIRGCVVVFRDVTKEREIDKAKSEFVSLASHQLRTPLSAINWYSEILMAGDAGKLNGDQKKYLDEIYRGSQRMVELVNSLLNTSRLELGTFVVEPELSNIVDIAESVISELEVMMKEKNINFKKKFDSKVLKLNLDIKLTRMIFQNLLSNAIKYSPNKSTVSLEIKKRKTDLLITVSDNGYGIPKKQQSKIFTKLFRADNVREMDTEGTGLGLYIIKMIIDQSGGKIKFESRENKGTTFYITMPLSGMKKKEGAKRLN